MGNICSHCCSNREDKIQKNGTIINGQTGVSAAIHVPLPQQSISKYDTFEMHMMKLWQSDKRALPSD